MKYFGYNPPFFGGHQNVLSRQSGDRLIKNDVLQLLLTAIGERVMRPTWGTRLNNSLFDQLDDETVETLENSISTALARYENRIRATVTITRRPDENILNVNVSGFFTDAENRAFELEINLPFGTRNA